MQTSNNTNNSNFNQKFGKQKQQHNGQSMYMSRVKMSKNSCRDCGGLQTDESLWHGYSFPKMLSLQPIKKKVWNSVFEK